MHLPHGVMSAKQIELLVDLAADFGIRELFLSGAEPFAEMTALKDLSRACKKRGIRIQAVTSAYWADCRDTVEKVLRGTGPWLHLTVSCDDYHQERVPLENCVHVIQAARGLNIPVHIATVEKADTVLTRLPSDIRREVPVMYQPLLGDHKLSPSEMEGVCPSVGLPYCESGTHVFACCGAWGKEDDANPLYWGTLRSLGQFGIPAEKVPAIYYLRLFGPLDLYRNVKPNGENHAAEFRDPCEICRKLFYSPRYLSRIQEFLEQERTAVRIRIAEAVLYANHSSDGNTT